MFFLNVITLKKQNLNNVIKTDIVISQNLNKIVIWKTLGKIKVVSFEFI